MTSHHNTAGRYRMLANKTREARKPDDRWAARDGSTYHQTVVEQPLGVGRTTAATLCNRSTSVDMLPDHLCNNWRPCSFLILPHLGPCGATLPPRTSPPSPHGRQRCRSSQPIASTNSSWVALTHRTQSGGREDRTHRCKKMTTRQ